MKVKILDVFADRLFSGNPTGIVFWEGDVDKQLMLEIAKELNVPDTIFIYDLNLTNKRIFNTLTFSPFEELAICGQGMIGAFATVKDDFEIKEGRYQIGTLLGIQDVFLKEDGRVYVDVGIPETLIAEEEVLATVFKILELDTAIIQKAGFVDLGRRRLIIQTNETDLAKLKINSENVLKVCTSFNITGVVFFAKIEQMQVRSRHFTTSLNGKEDAVTGGASGAILAFLNRLSNSCIKVNVYQGDFETKGGHIFCFKEVDKIFVGGSYVKVLDGKLNIGL